MITKYQVCLPVITLFYYHLNRSAFKMDGKENAAFDLEAQYIPKAGEELAVDSLSIHSSKEQVTSFDGEINAVEETAIDEINEKEEEEG